jgi:anti-sigma regulatory factor (Ser/Thr protein kinase)
VVSLRGRRLSEAATDTRGESGRHGWRVSWEYTLSSHVDSIRAARAHVRSALRGFADPDKLGRVELVVSELVTNSVRHGPGEPITLRFGTDAAGEIGGEVEDHGHGQVQMRPPSPETTVGGLGLPLVDNLTSDWGVHPGSTNVWFRFAA